MGVIMQAFHWDCPREDKKEFQWWNFINEKIPVAGKGWIYLVVASSDTQSGESGWTFDGL